MDTEFVKQNISCWKKSINTQCRIKCNFLSRENKITENSGGDFCKHMFSRLTTKLVLWVYQAPNSSKRLPSLYNFTGAQLPPHTLIKGGGASANLKKASPLVEEGARSHTGILKVPKWLFFLKIWRKKYAPTVFFFWNPNFTITFFNVSSDSFCFPPFTKCPQLDFLLTHSHILIQIAPPDLNLTLTPISTIVSKCIKMPPKN